MQLLLERDANAAMREAGPHRWPPLLYLAYSTSGTACRLPTPRSPAC
jgi:hypothetical protein